MAARMRYEASMLTGLAPCLQVWAGRGAARLHGSACSSLAGPELFGETGQKFGLEGGDDRGKRDHRIAPHEIEKPSIRALIYRVALCSVWVVRRVYFAVVRIK